MRRKALISAALALVLLLTFSAGAFGAAKPTGPVYTTVQQVQTMIDTALAPIKADIADLQTRLGLVETVVTADGQKIEALNSRIGALEASSGSGDFWPVSSLKASVETTTSWDYLGDPAGSLPWDPNLVVDYLLVTIPTTASGPAGVQTAPGYSDTIMKVDFNGKTYWTNDSAWRLDLGPIAPPRERPSTLSTGSKRTGCERTARRP